MRLFLGVDGGQSSTTALIGDETGRVLGAGSGGPCNHVGKAEGAAKLRLALTDSVGAACLAAGIEFAGARFEAACFGMSGGPDYKAAVIADVLRIGTLVNTDDAVIALSGATAGAAGIITIAGTGSIACGRNAAGRRARAGGWGYVFGDEGAGFDIARQALRAALRFEEGWGPPTALHGLLLGATGSQSANEALHWFYTDLWPRSRVATLAPLVDRAATEGDLAARDILLAAGQQLAALAASVRRQLWTPGEVVTVAYIGGVFRSELLLERFRLLVEMEDGNRFAAPVYGPAAGALIEAYRALGLRPPLTDVPELKGLS
jgi:N-acetylglucosamine kinase-like BadF-type ATPase